MSDAHEPTLTFVTRTKDRPLMLARAAASVAAQSWPACRWTIVNDGGAKEPVDAIVAASGIAPDRITVIHHEASVGMEAAANAGVAASESDYICLLDDDDTVTPDFAEKTVRFLESRGGQAYGGVITHTLGVAEEIKGDQIVELGRYRFNDWVETVDLTEMACGNFFTVNAFVYRRALWDQAGRYNPDLPVLGDWYFNLSFLLEADIAVIPEALAMYHQRYGGDDAAAYANTVTAGLDRHQEYRPIVRNRILRDKLATRPAAIVVALAYLGERQRAVSARARQPVPTRKEFNEALYLRLYPDIAAAVTARKFKSGYDHYVKFGHAEGRKTPIAAAKTMAMSERGKPR